MKLKAKAALILCCAMIFVVLSACAGGAADKPTKSPESPTETSKVETSTPEETEKDAEEPEITAEPEVTEPVKPELTAVDDIMVVDANLYDTKENPVPVGQWVCYQRKNSDSGEYEPFYVRIIGVSRDEAEVKAALESYDGFYDLSLTEDQARDIEYGILEYEVYFARDYEAPEKGIDSGKGSITFYAEPITTPSFKTPGGTSYIGIGGVYWLDTNGSAKSHPGDILSLKVLFTVLKNYDESEYMFYVDWYDGEITAEKTNRLYLAIS